MRKSKCYSVLCASKRTRGAVERVGRTRAGKYRIRAALAGSDAAQGHSHRRLCGRASPPPLRRRLELGRQLQEDRQEHRRRSSPDRNAAARYDGRCALLGGAWNPSTRRGSGAAAPPPCVGPSIPERQWASRAHHGGCRARQDLRDRPIDWTAGSDLQKMNERRAAYIAALKAADNHEIAPLLAFVGAENRNNMSSHDRHVLAALSNRVLETPGASTPMAAAIRSMSSAPGRKRLGYGAKLPRGATGGRAARRR